MANFRSYCDVIFWDFVRKDNAVYNFDIINSLIHSSRVNQNKFHYYKPTVILMVSIIECVLYDFLCRVKQEKHEGINLSKREKSIIRKKDLPKRLKNYIDICKRHSLLGNKKPNIYDGLYKYLEIRNRIHIQNINQAKPEKEWELWKKEVVKSCGRLLEDIIIFLCENYPRAEKIHNNPNLDAFPALWDKL